MSKSNYEKFAYETEYTPEAIAQAATMVDDGGSRERFYAPTGFGEGIDQKLAVYLTAAPAADLEAAPVVRLTAFSDDNGRPEGGYFDAFLSQALGRPVLAANAPGVDYSKWRGPDYDTAHLMTPDQREALMKKGSFDPVGAAVMRALVASSKHFKLPEGYFVTATSMGVALGGGMIREGLDAGVQFEGITLGEPVNIVDRSLARLALQFGLQFAPANHYLDQNPSEIPKEKQGNWIKRVREAWTANHAYARGLGRAGLLHDLGNLSDIADSEIPVLLGRGTESTLTPQKTFAEIAQAFDDAKVNPVIEINHGDGHAYTLTVQSVVKSARKIST
jgi:hypothetical protein